MVPQYELERCPKDVNREKHLYCENRRVLLWEHLQRGESSDVEGEVGGLAERGGGHADRIWGEALVAQLCG